MGKRKRWKEQIEGPPSPVTPRIRILRRLPIQSSIRGVFWLTHTHDVPTIVTSLTVKSSSCKPSDAFTADSTQTFDSNIHHQQTAGNDNIAFNGKCEWKSSTN